MTDDLPTKTGLTRRQFLIRTAAAVASAAGVYAYATKVEPHWLQLVHQPLAITDLPQGLVGATLVQLTDIHVGPRVSDDYVLDSFRRVQALRPDLVVITGDFVSAFTSRVSDCSRIYAEVPHGRLGTFGVLGNHDYGYAWSDDAAADRLTSILADCGVRILRNEHVTVGGLQVVGFDDLWARHFEPSTALRGIESGRPMIALSHNPDTADLAGWEGFSGRILSGHTHGGQCRPPFLPPPFLPVANRRYTAGVFDLPGDRSMYISRGVGHITQARFLVRPEVAVFTLSAG